MFSEANASEHVDSREDEQDHLLGWKTTNLQGKQSRNTNFRKFQGTEISNLKTVFRSSVHCGMML
jgi:hypothetical protein